MKKLLGIVVLGLLFSNVVFASDYRNIVKNLKCYSYGMILRNLDIKNEKNFYGYISDDEVDFSLIITAKEVDYGIWDASLLEINFAGKYEYDVTELNASTGGELRDLNASGVFHKDTYLFRLISHDTHDDKQYYEVERISLSNINLIPKKKQLTDMHKMRFNVWVNTYICLE
jgi:hypothetical protein